MHFGLIDRNVSEIFFYSMSSSWTIKYIGKSVISRTCVACASFLSTFDGVVYCGWSNVSKHAQLLICSSLLKILWWRCDINIWTQYSRVPIANGNTRHSGTNCRGCIRLFGRLKFRIDICGSKWNVNCFGRVRLTDADTSAFQHLSLSLTIKIVLVAHLIVFHVESLYYIQC